MVRTPSHLAVQVTVCLALWVAGFWVAPSLGGAPHLLKNINTVLSPPNTDEPARNFAKIGNTIYFTNDDAVHGPELWKTDGTPAGTTMVRDINPVAVGSCSGLTYPTVLNGILYFTAMDRTSNWELWRSDGTLAGTAMVKEINTATQPYPGADIAYITVYKGLLFFSALTATYGKEVWVSDGTEAGTVLFKDICPGSVSSNPYRFTEFKGELYFAANDGTSGYEPWKTDGTPAHTVMLKDVLAGSLGSAADWFTVSGNQLFFTARFGSGYDRKLWRTDGTTAGTVLVKDLNIGSYGRFLTDVNGTLFFVGNTYGLYRTDGTAANTIQLQAFWQDPRGAPSQLVNLNGRLVFAAGRSGDGRELWTSDGSIGGTVMLKDINPGSGDGLDSAASDFYAPLLVRMGNQVYFAADDGSSGSELWKTDGTPAGTTRVVDLYPGPAGSRPLGLFVLDDVLYFTANDGVHGTSLFKTDGTAEGTVLIRKLRVDEGDSRGGGFTALNDAVCFVAQDNASGNELWRTDGTTEGTSLVKDICPGECPSYPSYLAATTGKLFFWAWDPDYEGELWASDGTEVGTTMVKDINPTGSAIYGEGTYPPTPWGDEVFFPAYEGVHGVELWKSDGTEAGTVMVKDISSGESDSWPGLMVVFQDLLFMSAGEPAAGRELWVSDGTEAGTSLLKDIEPGAGTSYPQSLTVVGDTLFFIASTSVAGRELWKTDGTGPGTTLVCDLVAGTAGSNPGELTAVGGTVFFEAVDAAGRGVELHRTNGTCEGTICVKDINPGAANSNPDNLLAVGNLVFFTATDVDHGREPWVSDGTEAGTFMLADLVPGPGSGINDYFDRVAATPAGPVIFTAYTIDHGLELWCTDGTSEGTRRISDIAPGILSSIPTGLTMIGSRLYFTANDNVTGYEPWVLDLTDEDSDGVLDVLDDCPATILGAAVDHLGCPPRISGDFDRDGDVDGADLTLFEACASGPGIAYGPGCGAEDLDNDNDVDQTDFGTVQQCFSGANVPADPDCAE